MFINIDDLYEVSKILAPRDFDHDVYLYSKGWYGGKDMVSDLQRIYGLRNVLNVESIKISDIVRCMTKLVLRHMVLQAGHGKAHLLELISDLSPDNAWRTKRYDGDYDYYKQVISKYLSILSMTKDEDIPGGLTTEPNNLVLPVIEGGVQRFRELKSIVTD